MKSRKENVSAADIRDHSELTVRNGSKLIAAPPANEAQPAGVTAKHTGRPPVLDDEALDDLVEALRCRSGNLPSIDNLIAAAGGCQRQRASKALQRARSSAAQRELVSLLRLPTELEQLQRRWIHQWLEAAAAQLAEHHADLVNRYEQRIEALEALISEQREAMTTLRERQADLDRMTDELLRVREEDKMLIERLRAERDIAERLASRA